MAAGYPLEFTVVLIKRDDGEVEGVAAIMRDATEGWQRERELKRRVEELERKLEEFRGMSKRRDADVVIIGGGITGCAAAYHLAKRGKRVTVVEERGYCWGGLGAEHGRGAGTGP